jgi:hypothetical protein
LEFFYVSEIAANSTENNPFMLVPAEHKIQQTRLKGKVSEGKPMGDNTLPTHPFRMADKIAPITT